MKREREWSDGGEIGREEDTTEKEKVSAKASLHIRVCFHRWFDM